MNEFSDFNAKFLWLISPFAPLPKDQFSEKDIQEICLFIEQQCWRILPIVMPKFFSCIGQHSLDMLCVKLLMQKAIMYKEYAKIQAHFLSKIAVLLNRKRVPYAFLKSSALRWIIYNNPSERFGVDIDIAVPSNWIERCTFEIKEIGFKTAQWNNIHKRYEKANPIARKVYESRSYELGFFIYRLELENVSLEVQKVIRNNVSRHSNLWFLTSNGTIGCYQALDIHHGLNNERRISVEPLLENCCTVEIGEIKYRLPKLSWLLLHLICKIYFERSFNKTFYQYADVYRLISKMSYEECVSFPYILDDYNLKSEASYVLQRITSTSQNILDTKISALLK